MITNNSFRKNLTAEEISLLFQEALEEVHRPATERILSDVELCRMLNVSKRLTASWRSNGTVAYHKVGGIIFYLLADVLKMINEHRIETVSASRKIQ